MRYYKNKNALAIIISLQTDFLFRSTGTKHLTCVYGAHLSQCGVLAGGEGLLQRSDVLLQLLHRLPAVLQVALQLIRRLALLPPHLLQHAGLLLLEELLQGPELALDPGLELGSHPLRERKRDPGGWWRTCSTLWLGGVDLTYQLRPINQCKSILILAS